MNGLKRAHLVSLYLLYQHYLEYIIIGNSIEAEENGKNIPGRYR